MKHLSKVFARHGVVLKKTRIDEYLELDTTQGTRRNGSISPVIQASDSVVNAKNHFLTVNAPRSSAAAAALIVMHFCTLDSIIHTGLENIAEVHYNTLATMNLFTNLSEEEQQAMFVALAASAATTCKLLETHVLLVGSFCELAPNPICNGGGIKRRSCDVSN